MKLLSSCLGPSRGRWRFLVLTFWYSFLFSTILVYLAHYHTSSKISTVQQTSLLQSLKENTLSRFFSESGYLSLKSLQERFKGLSISRVFRTIAGDDSLLVEDIEISGNEVEVDRLLENVTFLTNGSNVEVVKVIEKVNVPVTATIDSTSLSYLNESGTVTPTQAPLVPGYERIGNKETLRLHCSVCAVVASSGHLINSSAGSEINQYPCVIRMNSATTVNFENDVGKKTDIRVVGFVNMKELKNHTDWQEEIFENESTRAPKVIIPWLYFRTVDKDQDQYYLIAKAFAKKYPLTEFYLLNTDKMKRAEEIFKAEVGVSRKDANTWLTTGWMTMLFALDVCDAIDVYGLAKDNHCILHPNDSTPYHYYPPYDKTECSYYKKSEEKLHMGHKFITEKAVFERWANTHKISFHYPHWQANKNTLNKTLDTPFLKRYKEAKQNSHSTIRNGTRVIRRVVKRVIKKVIVRRKVPVKASHKIT